MWATYCYSKRSSKSDERKFRASHCKATSQIRGVANVCVSSSAASVYLGTVSFLKGMKGNRKDFLFSQFTCSLANLSCWTKKQESQWFISQWKIAQSWNCFHACFFLYDQCMSFISSTLLHWKLVLNLGFEMFLYSSFSFKTIYDSCLGVLFCNYHV